MLTFRCDKCGLSKQVDEHHAGKRTKCPRCGTAGAVPAVPAEPPAQLVFDPSGPTLIQAAEQRRRSSKLPLLITISMFALVVAAIVFVTANLNTKPGGPVVIVPTIVTIESAETKVYRAKMREFIDQANATANILIDPTSYNHCKEQILKAREAFSRVPDPPEMFAKTHTDCRDIFRHFDQCIFYLDLWLGYAAMSGDHEKQKNEMASEVKKAAKKAKAATKAVAAKF